jgi:hypothetical protein
MRSSPIRRLRAHLERQPAEDRHPVYRTWLDEVDQNLTRAMCQRRSEHQGAP